MASSIISYEDFPAFFQKNKVLVKYDPSVEVREPHDWWTVDNEKVLESLKSISKSSTEAMEGMAGDDEEVKHLKKIGDSLYKVSKSKTFLVALSGPQAAGKSSFLNGLLDCPGLCISGADGRACTNAVVIYCYYQGLDEDTAMAEIKFHSADRIQEIVQELAQSYYHFYHFDDELAEMEEPTAKKNAHRHDESDVKAKDTAQDIFETLFGGKEQFKDAWSPDGYRDQTFQKEAIRKCVEAISRLNVDSNFTLTCTASNPPELSRKLRPYTTKVAGQASLWPLVNTIRYGLNRDLLRQGFEFVDLPGWGDRNAAKERHADEIRDTVDLEMIFVDTSRITSENVAINNIRSAIQTRGPENVIIIATKIDALSDDELDQSEGEDLEKANRQLQWAEEKAVEAADSGDDDEERMLTNYALYLRRTRKSFKIVQRCQSIDADFSEKFDDITAGKEGRVSIFHVSSSNYTGWINRSKIPFAKQPDLTPVLTGIPGIRKFLFHLPAESNLRDLRYQVFEVLMSYIGKIDRVVNQEDRSEGFKMLAENFAQQRVKLISQLQSGILINIQRPLEAMISDPRANAVYKQEIDDMIENNWCSYAHGTFNRVLKEKGMVAKGMSTARALKDGCDWNQELSAHLKDALDIWMIQSNQMNKVLRESLITFLKRFHKEVALGLEYSKSDVAAISIAKRQWLPHKNKLLSHVEKLIQCLVKRQATLYQKALMVDGRQNGLIPVLTYKWYDEIYNALPAEKPTSTLKKRLFVEPKSKFQKRKLRELYCSPINHIYDKAMETFRTVATKTLGQAIQDKIQAVDDQLKQYNDGLQENVPTPYELTARGVKIRESLRNMLSDLQEEADALKNLMPNELHMDNGHGIYDAPEIFVDVDSSTNDLSVYIEKAVATRPQPPTRLITRKAASKESKVRKEPDEEEAVFGVVPARQLSIPLKSQPSKKRKLKD